MTDKSDNSGRTSIEVRRDAGIARMLNNPPKPHKDMKKGAAKIRGQPDEKEKSK